MNLERIFLILTSIALIICTLKMNSIYSQREACLNSRAEIIRKVDMLVNAIEGKRPDIELQLMMDKGEEI